MKITGSLDRADDGGWSNTSQRKRLRILFVAAVVCGQALSWKRISSWGQQFSSLFLNEGIELQTHSTFGGRLYCFMHVYGLITRSELKVRCVAIDGHTRDIAQHICAKMHLNLTVVLISRPIGPWKKNSPRSLIRFVLFHYCCLIGWEEGIFCDIMFHYQYLITTVNIYRKCVSV